MTLTYTQKIPDTIQAPLILLLWDKNNLKNTCTVKLALNYRSVFMLYIN